MKRQTTMLSILGCALGCLLAVSCGRAPKLTLTASSETLISGCVVSVRAQVQDGAIADEAPIIDWYIDGVRVPDESQADIDVTREVTEPVTIVVSAKPAGRFGAPRTSIAIRAVPVPFRDPLTSDYEFTESPVIARGENQYLDPGAIAFRDGKFHAVFNAIARYPEIRFGHAVSPDGIEWKINAPIRENAMTIDTVAKAIGIKPRNIHAGSLIFDKGEWLLFFTAANAGDFFYGNAILASAASADGPWKIDPTPVLGAVGNDWFKGDQGLPQIFKLSDTEYRLYYATRKGAVGLARSTDGKSFVKDDAPIANALLPAIEKTSWGWVMISNNTIYLSLDGLAWQRYARPLFSAEDLETRKITNLMVTSLRARNGRYYYFLEGSTRTNSDVYLISWKE